MINSSRSHRVIRIKFYILYSYSGFMITLLINMPKMFFVIKVTLVHMQSAHESAPLLECVTYDM